MVGLLVSSDQAGQLDRQGGEFGLARFRPSHGGRHLGRERAR